MYGYFTLNLLLVYKQLIFSLNWKVRSDFYE